MKHIAIIGNAHAGKGAAASIMDSARRALWGWKCEFTFPASASELIRYCANLNPEIYEAAVVIGGDGTMNQAIRGLVRSMVPLYAFPGGTANDLATELKIQADWKQAQRLLDGAHRQHMDLIEVNGVPFATVAGIGVGAHLTTEFNERRQNSRFFRSLAKNFKSEIYTGLAIKNTIFKWNNGHKLHIQAGVFDEKLKTAAMFICNQTRLGGDMKVASQSDNSDQRFGVLIIPGASKVSLLRGLASLKMGILPEDFISFSTDELVIRDLGGKPIRVFGDGEILSDKARLNFRILPQAISVYGVVGRSSVASAPQENSIFRIPKSVFSGSAS